MHIVASGVACFSLLHSASTRKALNILRESVMGSTTMEYLKVPFIFSKHENAFQEYKNVQELSYKQIIAEQFYYVCGYFYIPPYYSMHFFHIGYRIVTALLSSQKW